ncbi:ChaN family lipoprotein [Hydrogenophaga sp.]|uniref:ChaN family lipoprotein n=1 Tax=Hydrogenophaga sp. TaxID=1904254 RepID=UPI00356735C5
MNCHRAVAATGWAFLSLLGVQLMSACASSASIRAAPSNPLEARLAPLLPTPLLLLGEQHDAAEHQVLQREVVQLLAAQGRLAALVMEMAEQGRSSQGLTQQASEAQVREALAWSDSWPWSSYGPVVMSAVRAGVPVLGGNLPRPAMRAAMADAELDQLLPPAALAQQRQDIRDGHCGLLPEAQIAPMTRIQLARDQAMAQTLVQALRDHAQAGQTVLLVAGNGHVRRDLGVPRHLPVEWPHQVLMALAAGSGGQADGEQALRADAVWAPPARPPRDYCAEFAAPAKKP